MKLEEDKYQTIVGAFFPFQLTSNSGWQGAGIKGSLSSNLTQTILWFYYSFVLYVKWLLVTTEFLGKKKIKNLFRHLFLFFLPLYEVLLHEREQNDSLLSAKWKAVILWTSSLWNGTDEVGNTKSLKAHGFYSTISGREEGFMQNCSLKRGQIGRQSFPVKKALIMWQQCFPSTLWRSTRVQGILKYLLSQ